MKNINISKLKAIFKKGNISLKKVIIATSLIGAITLTGCSQNNKSVEEQLADDGISIVSIESYIDDNYYMIKEMNQDGIEKNISFDMGDEKVEYNKLCTPAEFGKYTGESNITYDDIRTTLSKSNIDDNIKSIVLKGINNLENNNFNMSLEVLNYNLKNLTIEYKDTNDEIITDYIVPEARFIPNEHKVLVYNDNIRDLEKSIIHEILGHGMNMAYIDNEKIYCSDCMLVSHIENKKIDNMFRIGETFCESLAEVIRYYATNEKIKNDDTAYSPYVYSFLLLCETNGINIEDYANNGVELLLEKMNNNGLKNQNIIIKNIDDNFKCTLYGGVQVDYYLEDFFEEYLKSCALNYNDIDNYYHKVIKNIDCYKKYFDLKIDPEDNCNYIYTGSQSSFDFICIESLKSCVKEFTNSEKVLILE